MRDSAMRDLISKLHHSKFLGLIFHTLNYCLQRELKDCESVLDLGCGSSSPLQYCSNIKYSVGVEAFSPYLEKSKRKKIHTEYIEGKIENLDFPENSFDSVIMIEVLEHLPTGIGLEILKRAEKWATKKVIVSSPNGFLPEEAVDNNPLQKHVSGWDYYKMKKLGFKSYGLAGLKFLRQKGQNDTTGDDLTSTIRFRPKIFWLGVAALSQLFTYFVPQAAFELFSVKKITEK